MYYIYIFNFTYQLKKKLDKLSIIGKVMQRAECTPIQNDTNYLQLKR